MTERSIRNRILAMSRSAKQALMLATDFVGFSLSVWMAAWLLFGSEIPFFQTLLLIAAVLIVAIPLAWKLGFYHSVVRYVGVDLIIAAIWTTSGSTFALIAAAFLANLVSTPTRFGIAYWTISLLYLLGSRWVARYCLNRRNRRRENVIVYGAGSAGSRLVVALLSGESFLPVAMVDDNQSKQGKSVSGLVVKSPDRIASLASQLNATRVLLALPSISRRARLAIITELEKLSVRVQVMPEIDDLASGHARVDDIRDIDVSDLLGRITVPPDPKLLGAPVHGKAVLVTGAGGSIGSELCRQILRQTPKLLVLFEVSEASLYQVNKDLCTIAEKDGIRCEILALLGSVVESSRIREVMKTFKVDTVYHAAAYKHVPLVEQNIIEGIHNNVFGTLCAAEAAIDTDVETFVLVSTDKAVCPTNVMGATKRLAEIVLQALQSRSKSTRFCMVRFGNVLASSGSVVPLFQEQIRNGGPVTVTHCDIIRYFMTIPEAAQLVIQASAMTCGGDVFVLDMGQPVKISDLARRVINLMGLEVRDNKHPDGDIEIQYTGLRPAEKLYEELLIGTNASKTEHPRIMRAVEDYIQYSALEILLEDLRLSVQSRNRIQARSVLLTSVNEYAPTNGIEDLVWTSRRRTSDTAIDDQYPALAYNA